MKPRADLPGDPGMDPGRLLRVEGAVRVSLVGSSAYAALDPCIVVSDGGDASLRVDGAPTDAHLRMQDREHAVFTTGDGGTRRVLFPILRAQPVRNNGVERREVIVDGWRVEVEIESEARAVLRARARRNPAEGIASGPMEVRAMIPGVVLAIPVVEGDTVTVGQTVVVVEAMKMQNELQAPRDGTIERVMTAPGAKIEVGDLLLVIV